MISASGKSKNKAMLKAAKALSVAAASLASAAEALSLLCEEQEQEEQEEQEQGQEEQEQGQEEQEQGQEEQEQGLGEDNITVKSDDSAPIDVASPMPAPAVDYDSEDSDDDYMALAREAVRVATAPITPALGGQTPVVNKPAAKPVAKPVTKPEDPKPQEEQNFSVSLADIQARFAAKHKGTTSTPSVFSIPASTAARSEQSFAPPPPDLSSWGAPTTNTTPGGSTSGRPKKSRAAFPGGTSVNSDRPSQQAEAPPRVPFQNLILNWQRPTILQRQTLNSLRTGKDMLLYHGNLKSHTHAILVRCMEVLKKQPYAANPNGIISALFIVPQQGTGRSYLNFANQLFSDFGLPHKAMLLPGGGTELAAEIEKMSSERIDILLSTPRVFINHINSNPNITNHLAKVRMVVYAGAHELVKNETFLSFQFNSIKKRMQTRAKSPRQVIITGNNPNDVIQSFAMRALAVGSDLVMSTASGDGLSEGSWQEYLRRR